MNDIKLIVGGTLEDDAADFVNAWQRTEAGEQVPAERVLAFDNWEALSAVLTGERFRLLRHIHAHPEASISALASSLHRQYSRVHADVKALEGVGLLVRDRGMLRTAAGRITADIRL
jgi:predicted transcriptional regulator